MKTQLITICILLISGTSLYAESLTNQLERWNRFCAIVVKGSVEPLATPNRQMRGMCATNVFLPLTAKGYTLSDYSPPEEYRTPEVLCQYGEYLTSNGTIRFSFEYTTSSDVNIGGQVGLMDLTKFYCNRMPPYFWQYRDGPGNICLLDTYFTLEKFNELDDVFFCRDNVAVRVRKFDGDGNVLEFARMLDACILATPATNTPSMSLLRRLLRLFGR